ncbi:heparinase II/III family protein [Crateriforma spongiae]|uniref:heparinase II/III domain-containing protein n=1 Tax=Crateriforma spongiae TaxID=2724528 RepID=UPI0039B03B6F
MNWTPSEVPRLWRFHLHYHEAILDIADLLGDDAAWRIIRSWLADPRTQSPDLDPDTWHPFCISQRLPNWMILASRDVPTDIADPFWISVAKQIDWLWRHPETDLGGNHLLENLRALAIADAALDVSDVIDRDRLWRWIDSELDEQILASGEHFERTPTYHALMTFAVLEIALANRSVQRSTKCDSSFSNMLQWGKQVLHPDGKIPLLGDSVFGETPSIPQMDSFSRRHQTPTLKQLTVKAVNDYWIQRSTNGKDFLVFDHGEIGCDHLPAHGHADLFNFELSVDGRRFIVDTGTFDYEDSERRKIARSSAAHNVCVVDQQDHADVWSRFRMGRRGHVQHSTTGQTNQFRWIVCAHDAYRHLGVPLSYRLVACRHGDNPLSDLFVIDWHTGDQRHRMTSYLHLAPGIAVDESNSRSGEGCPSYQVHWDHLSFVDGCEQATASQMPIRTIVFSGDASVAVADSEYYPDFGVALRNQTIRATCEADKWQTMGYCLTEGIQAWDCSIDTATSNLQLSWKRFNESEQQQVCIELQT